MGCGQSKIHLYPRKSKSKANGKKGGHADSDTEADEDEAHQTDTTDGQASAEEKQLTETNEESTTREQTRDTEEDNSTPMQRTKNLSLLQNHRTLTTSQQNFFRMLDEKIEEGPDYDSGSETEIALEEARLNSLVHHWESVSINTSVDSPANRSLQTTPIRQLPFKPLHVPRGQLLSASEFLPHGMNQQMTATAASKQQFLGNNLLTQQQQQQQQHQTQAGINLDHTDSNVACANISSAGSLALMQSAQMQYTHHLSLPGSGNTNIVSPKRLFMQPVSGLGQLTADRFQTAMINGARSPQPSATAVNQPPMAIQMAYYNQSNTAQPYELHHQSDALSYATYNQSQNYQTMSSAPGSYYGSGSSNISSDMLPHTVTATATPAPPTEYKFPPAISVQRLAPQVQRQLRETQELIKDSSQQLYAAGYGSPGPPMRNPNRNPVRNRPTLETQFSQELS